MVKQKNVQMLNFMKKEKDVVITNEMPLSFAMTEFHIVFVYYTNYTVVSKISEEVIHYKSFDSVQLKGIKHDIDNFKLLLYTTKEPVHVSHIEGEDQDAWKYFLKKGLIREALTNCKTKKQEAYVSGIYADQLFQKQKYQKAAEYYAQSEKTFEEIALKFMKNPSLFIHLEHYL